MMFSGKNLCFIIKVLKFRPLPFQKTFFIVYIIMTAAAIKVQAQRDVIITQANEEIRCRILDETPTRFVYAYIGSTGKVLRNEIFKNLVKDFNYNRYESDLAITDFDKSKSKNGKRGTVKTPAKRNPGIEKKATREQEDIVLSETKKASKREKTFTGLEVATEQKNPEIKPEEDVAKEAKQTRPPVGIVLSKQSKHSTATNSKERAKAIGITLSPAPNGTLTESRPKNEFKNYLKWRIGAKVGIGNILDNTFEATNAFGLYQEKLLKGWDFGVDLAFFPMEGFGIGAVYTNFTSSNTATNLNFTNQMTGVEASGSISNKISRKFIGSAFFFRKSIDYKTFVVLGLSPGLNLYSNIGEYNSAQFHYKGQEFGAAATLGLDFLLGNDIVGRDIILSLEAGYNRGKINGLDYGDGAGEVLLDNPILLDRVDFSIGLRFMRFPKYLKK